ncbi:MAG: hypothetical protein E1N59_2650 [Puniceicoccaceae bacterium 5H]|nr:MAG: hypothetical protein E1N59_2650 [Puniceicoccaceae bacterium 5H]
MPLYEYTCQACDHAFEALVQGSQSPSCPECGSDQLEKKWSTFAPSMGGSQSADLPMCQTCGQLPGACGLN